MKLIVPDQLDTHRHPTPLDRAARSYGMRITSSATFEGMPRPWIALEVTSRADAIPVTWLNFDAMKDGTVVVGYTPSGLPDDVLDLADMVVYVEQFDDAARLPRDQALAVFLHEAYQQVVKKRRRA